MQKEYIGSFRYKGKLVEGGVLDARSGSRALIGIDNVLKFFITQERPDLVGTPLPIPVKIQEGSWEALIPETIGGWITGAAGLVVTAYATTAANKIAEHDFKDKGIKDVAKDALICIQWLIKIGKHLGHLAIRNLEKAKLETPGLIEITNKDGHVLQVPISIFKRLLSCPKNALSDLACVIEVERTLEVVVNQGESTISVEVKRSERAIFYDESEDADLLFPELIHGMIVELGGVVTRGNEMSNTIGFHYNGHILTCVPKSGSIVRFKTHLFLPCKIYGEVSRADKKGNSIENRPKIIFESLEIIPQSTEQLNLFPLDDTPGDDA